jgi:hypothetical protein
MGFVLPAVKKNKNGAEIVRIAIPVDVRDEYARLYGRRWEERWRPKAGQSPADQKRGCADWIGEINRRIATIRAARRGEGIELSHKDALALAGEWYTWFVTPREDAPGDPAHWDQLFWQLIEAMEQHAPPEVREQPQHDLSWARDPDVRDGIRPVLADFGHTAQFLAGRGIPLTNEAQVRFLNCVLDNYIEALWLLDRRARGDYEPDELPRQFPKFTGRKQASTIGQTPWVLFKGWVTAKQPGERTINRWRVVFEDLERKFAASGADGVSEDDARAWATALITPERSGPDSKRHLGKRCTHGLRVGQEPTAHSQQPFCGRDDHRAAQDQVSGIGCIH